MYMAYSDHVYPSLASPKFLPTGPFFPNNLLPHYSLPITSIILSLDFTNDFLIWYLYFWSGSFHWTPRSPVTSIFLKMTPLSSLWLIGALLCTQTSFSSSINCWQMFELSPLLDWCEKKLLNETRMRGCLREMLELIPLGAPLQVDRRTVLPLTFWGDSTLSPITAALISSQTTNSPQPCPSSVAFFAGAMFPAYGGLSL